MSVTDSTQGGGQGPTSSPSGSPGNRRDEPLELNTTGFVSPPHSAGPARSRPPPKASSSRPLAPALLAPAPPSSPHSRDEDELPPVSRLANALGAIAQLLLRVTAVLFRQAKTQGARALTDFRGRPKHTRYRAYALGGYCFIVLATFAFQTWEPNELHAYVRVEPVALPSVTVIFVRNDSNKPWKDVRLKLNGLYGYERNQLLPSQNFQLALDRFAVYDSSGKATFAPKDIVPHDLVIECDRGRFETELKIRK